MSRAERKAALVRLAARTVAIPIARALPTKGSACFDGQPEVCGGIPGVVEGLSALMNADEIGLDDDICVDEREAISASRELCARG